MFTGGKMKQITGLVICWLSDPYGVEKTDNESKLHRREFTPTCQEHFGLMLPFCFLGE
jgi:hypothetical protein